MLCPEDLEHWDEFFEAVTLMQTHKMITFPIVMVGKDYWGGLLNWMKERMVGEHNINEADMNIFTLVDTAAEAVKVIEEFYNEYALKPNF